MTLSNIRVASTLAALLLSTAAQAQVTAEQVWQDWKDLSASYGQTITAGSENRSGDTLVVSGMNINSTFEGGSVQGTVETVNFRELGDGTVEVTMSPEYPLTLNVTGEDGKPATVEIMVRQPGLILIAGGTDAETRYDFNAPTVKVSVVSVTSDGKPVDADVNLDITALSGNYLVTKGEMAKLASDLRAEGMTFQMSVADPAASSTFSMNGSVSQLAGKTEGTLMSAEAMTDMAAALAAGFNTAGTFSFGATSYDFSVDEAGQTAQGNATLAGGGLKFGMNADSLEYGGDARDVALKVTGSQLPFPELAMNYSQAAFNLLMPLSKSETPGNFALMTRLVDFTISDAVWDMVDPGKVLPRDPATLIIDTKGTAKWLVDIMTAAETEELPEGTVPGELHSLDISELLFKALGAEISGKGAFTFDNTDLVTFQGMPAPTGTLDLKILGANALLDKLISLGFVPEDQAMGARMMMGLFAKPIDGQEDALTSTLEFKDKGFYANGQRLQ
jgi:hypothetical protein